MLAVQAGDGRMRMVGFLQPVPGWQAERTFRRVRRGGAVQLAPGIRVAACPKFERDRRERRQSGR